MKRISLIKFQAILQKLNPSLFIYSSDNQDSYKCINFEMRFSGVKIIINQNVVYFSNDNVCLTINNINEIGVITTNQKDILSFTFFCSNILNSTQPETYTIFIA